MLLNCERTRILQQIFQRIREHGGVPSNIRCSSSNARSSHLVHIRFPVYFPPSTVNPSGLSLQLSSSSIIPNRVTSAVAPTSAVNWIKLSNPFSRSSLRNFRLALPFCLVSFPSICEGPGQPVSITVSVAVISQISLLLTEHVKSLVSRICVSL